MNKRIAAILLLSASAMIVCMLIYLEKWSPPETIQEMRGRSRIFFTVNHQIQVFSPLLLKWDLKNAEIVQVSGRGHYHPQKDARKIIGTDKAQILVEFPDGSRQKYYLPIMVLFETWQGLLLLLVLSIMPYTAAVLLDLVPDPGKIIKSIIISADHAVRRLKDTIRIEDKSHLAGLSGILIFATGLRLLYLNQPARLDESISFVFYADPLIPLMKGLSNYNLPNNHPLNTLLMHAASILFNSIQLWAIRLPAFAAGIMLVIATYAVTRLVYNKNAGLLAAALTASSSQLILYSTNARGYIFICLFFIALIGISYSFLRRSMPSTWFLFLLASTCGFYSLPLMAYPYAIVFVWIVIAALVTKGTPNRWFLIRDLIVATACVCWLTLILYLPLFIKNDVIHVLNRDYASLMSWPDFLMHLGNSVKGLVLLSNEGFFSWIRILLFVGFIAGVVFHRNLSKQKIPIVAAVVIGMSVILIVQRPYIRYARILIFILPVYFMVSSAGIIYLLERGLSFQKYRHFLILLLTLTVVGTNGYAIVQEQTVYNSGETGALHSAEDVTVYLKNVLQPKDRIFAPIPFFNPIFQYYFRRYGMDTTFLAWEKSNLAETNRLFVIVFNDRAGSMTVEQVLGKYQKSGYNRSDFNEPVLLKSYKFSKLYVMKRKQIVIRDQEQTERPITLRKKT